MKPMRVVGLMSGTSLDGIDVALIETDGHEHIHRLGFLCVPYDDSFRKRLRDCLNRPVDDFVRQVEADLTMFHAFAVSDLLEDRGFQPEDVNLIGFHGQTIAHAPDQGYTCQIGDGDLLAKMTGIPVVNDFRSADVKAGGQGAPLAPVYHQALAATQTKPVVFLNIGGVANITFIGSNGELIACDTGPGNALVDDWIFDQTGQKFDDGGKIAASGKVNEKILSELMAHPFFSKKPPKSLDRNAFASQAWRDLSLEDGAATLAAFTVEAIVRALDFMPEKPVKFIVSGGGRSNKSFIEGLKKRSGIAVDTIESLGLNGDAVEAEAFAYLAVRSVEGLPISFPGTTSAPKPMTGGTLHKIST